MEAHYPRVAFAFLSTLFNRWTTSRRFQQKLTCSLCRREGTEDSLEHFFFCGRTKVILQYMGLPHEAGEGGAVGLRRRFLLLDGATCVEERIKRYLLIYVLHSVFNMVKAQGVSLDDDRTVRELAEHFLMKGARGCAKTEEVACRMRGAIFRSSPRRLGARKRGVAAGQGRNVRHRA